MGQTTGTVKDTAGNPLPNVVVDFNKSTGGTWSDTTDANGVYSLFLQAGIYSADVGGDVCDPPSFNIPTTSRVLNLVK